MNWAESFSFLPVMVIAPQKFALLFAFGSMTMYHGKKRAVSGDAFFLERGFCSGIYEGTQGRRHWIS